MYILPHSTQSSLSIIPRDGAAFNEVTSQQKSKVCKMHALHVTTTECAVYNSDVTTEYAVQTCTIAKTLLREKQYMTYMMLLLIPIREKVPEIT